MPCTHPPTYLPTQHSPTTTHVHKTENNQEQTSELPTRARWFVGGLHRNKCETAVRNAMHGDFLVMLQLPVTLCFQPHVSHFPPTRPRCASHQLAPRSFNQTVCRPISYPHHHHTRRPPHSQPRELKPCGCTVCVSLQVRRSASAPSEILCVNDGGEIVNYSVHCAEGGAYSFVDRHFPTLDAVITYVPDRTTGPFWVLTRFLGSTTCGYQ
jgi:hypothetical protein